MRSRYHESSHDMVLECAVASGSRYVVTHNVKDFAGIHRLGIHAITPADFLGHLESP